MKDFLGMLFGLARTIVVSVAAVIILLLVMIGTIFGIALS